MTTSRKTFVGISPRAFEHPLDRTALGALRKVKGFDWVVRKFLMAIGERRLRLYFLASSVRVNEQQFARVDKLLAEACEILGVTEKPDLFIKQQFAANAAAIGVDKPFIVLTSSIVSMMNDQELQCVLGHELGHILCGHALYKTLLLLLRDLWFLVVPIPGGAYAYAAIYFALLEWSRKAELTSDRAGLLVSQDLEVSHHVDMKLAGGDHVGDMSLDEFRKQAQEYAGGGDLLDGVLKLALILKESHPFPVLRVAELDRWVESGDYAKILGGDYPKRDDGEGDAWLDDVKATADSYKDSVGKSKDPFVSTLRDLGGGAASLLDTLRRFATRGKESRDRDDKRDES